MPLPIDLEFIKKKSEIPEKLAELSYKDQDEAVRLMREWGERKIPITAIHKELSDCLQ